MITPAHRPFRMKGRRSKEKWEKYKAFMLQKLPDAKQVVLTYHKGTQRTYVIAVHPENAEKYDKLQFLYGLTIDANFSV